MAGVRVRATLSIDHADESWAGMPVHTCIGTTIRAVRRGADADEENDRGLPLLAVAALIPTHRPGVTSVPAALTQPLQVADVGYAVLPDGRGGTNVESVVYTDAMGFDKKRVSGAPRQLLRVPQHAEHGGQRRGAASLGRRRQCGA
jgi:hypothetical protein